MKTKTELNPDFETPNDKEFEREQKQTMKWMLGLVIAASMIINAVIHAVFFRAI